MTIFDEALVRPIINVLVAIYQLFFFLNVPYALGFAIIGLTIVIRLLLYPLIAVQLKASKKMQALSPELARVKNLHKQDAKRLQEETMRLYREHNINPASGCLPVIVQLPIIWALYYVSQKIVNLKPEVVVSEVNKLSYNVPFLKLDTSWDQYFFGLPLGQNPSQLLLAMPIVLVVPIITGLLQFIQSKMLVAPSPKGEKRGDDFASAFQAQSLYIFPIMIGIFSYTFPIGLSLYWNTFTVFGILQQYLVFKRRVK